MRLRTAAASAALVLGAVAGASACSSPAAPDAGRPAAPTAPAPAEGLEGKIETGERAEGLPEMNEQSVAGPARCATTAAEIPADCALDLTFAEFTEGERADGPPTLP
ncbi:hypothetical protein [Streptomyces sp. V2I9]|uniref:hypothetical protein n=1 Tax=Streptomyces sp. V2I9 TaxID=3042304 RepID=UPI00277FC58C|nr:hypothetical protein [Streptomyces sp. V2I9]MDQ0987051.1 hypothetical protein [Streptomyces sp. V2I9]